MDENENENKLITVSNQLKVGPALATLSVCFLVLAGHLSWWVILIVFLWGLDDSITINWRKLFRRWS